MKLLYSAALLCAFLFCASTQAAEPVISEFLASNSGPLVDENGDSSDWIEIYNGGTSPVNLSGWHLTDDAENLTQWTFPATTLAAGRFLLVFASGKNRVVPGAPLHANFQLEAAGEYLALVRPDGQIAQQFAPKFPPQVEGISYGTEVNTVTTRLLTNGVVARWRVPSSALDQPSDWADTNFLDAAWNTGRTGFGFDWGASNIVVGGTATNVALNKPVTQSSTLGAFGPELAVNGNAADFTHTSAGVNLPSTWEVILGTNYGIDRIIIGNRQDCCGSRLRDITVTILGLNGATNYNSPLLNPENTLGSGVNGPATLTLNLTQLTGAVVVGARVRITRTPDPDLSGSGGQGNADEANVLSLGEVEVMALPAAGSFNSLIRTDLASVMSNINATALFRLPFQVVADELPPLDQLTLRVNYDDGFVAYLNGLKVAEVNAPATPVWDSTATGEHPDAAAFVAESFDLTAHAGLLQDGVNVLAIQGLNRAAEDDDFLLLPELTGISVAGSAERYFTQPSPTNANSGGSLGLVADTKFSVDRGFFDVPFTVAVATATVGAQIYFTTNGSAASAVNGSLYTGPILISRTTVLRAIATKPGWTPSDVDTHTYIFPTGVVAQSHQSVTNAGYPNTWAGVAADYAMDPRITLSNTTQMVPALRSLPSMFISTSVSNLFDPTRGIYSLPDSHGVAWERPASIELVDTNGNTEFQEDAGLRIQGGYFRQATVTQKHSLRVLFKSQYGVGKLNHDLFKRESAVSRFDGFVLRSGANDGYSWDAAKDTEQFIRVQFGQDLHLSMGHSSPHGLFVHLYLNGVYWGLYNLVERPNEDFSSSYYGGNPLEWDANNAGDVKSGDLAAFNTLVSLSQSATGNTNYQRMQGNHPDGTRDPALPVYLDKLNYIDYMVANIWGGNWDWPNKNFWFGRDRTTNSTGFKFYMWDYENTMGNNRDRSPINMVSPRSGTENTWVGQPHFYLKNNLEYRIDFADRVQRYFFNEGLLTPGILTNRYRALADWVELSIYAETARWGDDNLNPPQDIEDWRRERDWMLGSYLVQRSAVVLAQFRASGLYPNVTAPLFSQLGGTVLDGYPLELTHTNTSGVIYFTTDGSDPRLRGGAVNPLAQPYGAPIAINNPLYIRARVLTGTNWSAIVESLLSPLQNLDQLRVTEIMYNPPAFGLVDGEEVEFLELKNTGTKTLHLTGLRFTDGIEYTFPLAATLAPGAFYVLVSNAAHFTNKYPGVTVRGVYSGHLNNDGETITLSHLLGGKVLSVAYGDEAPWPLAPDNFGFSLVPWAPNTNPDPDYAANWRASTFAGGSPGADDPAATVQPIFLNEILTHSETGVDFIELFNPNAFAVNLGGWFLTDNANAPKKFRLPATADLEPMGFLVLTEADFNATPGTNQSFSLNGRGDDVYLFSGDATTNLTGYSHGFSFGASPDGGTFGRYVISTGEEQFPAQLAATPGLPNAGPLVGPVVLNEIHYHPGAGGDEFIELKNITTNRVTLYDIAHPTNTWRLNGLGYDFPTNLTLEPGTFALLVATNPAVFRARYSIPESVLILGPYAGSLQDSGERLELQRPDVPDTNGLAFITVDEVRYNDRAPWPVAADGSGASLQRLASAAYGNDPANWTAAVPTPGADFPGGPAPAILTQPRSQIGFLGSNVLFSVSASGTPPLRYAWRFNGNLLPGQINSTLALNTVTFAQAGSYSVLVFNDAGSVASAPATLTLIRLPLILLNPANQYPRPGSNAVFSVNATGTGFVRYQWQFNGVNLLNQTNASLLVANAQFANVGLYTVTLTDNIGTAITVPALLDLAIDPIITQQPLSQTMIAGSPVTLSLSVTNTATLPIGYRIRRNGSTLATTVPGAYVTRNERTVYFTFSGTNTMLPWTNYAIIATNLAKPSGNLSLSAFLTFQTDGDGDGLADQWETNFFGTSLVVVSSEDSDGDGMTNGQEYQAGTNPTDASSYLKINSITATSGVTLTFGAISNRTYSVQFNDVPGGLAWTKLLDVPARATNRVETIPDPTATTNRFYRLATPQQAGP